MSPIKYRVIASKLPANPDGYIAQVQSYRTVRLDEIVNRIVNRGTTVAKPDVLNVLGHYYTRALACITSELVVKSRPGTIKPRLLRRPARCPAPGNHKSMPYWR